MKSIFNEKRYSGAEIKEMILNQLHPSDKSIALMKGAVIPSHSPDLMPQG